jgi:hypothetical protein
MVKLLQLQAEWFTEHNGDCKNPGNQLHISEGARKYGRRQKVTVEGYKCNYKI